MLWTIALTPSATRTIGAGCASQQLARVFVANGAGDFRATSKALCQAVGDEHLALVIETVPWSHGAYRMISDQIDSGHARRQGRLLAEHVLAQRAMFPYLPIYLVGHSAGCAVVLRAAEGLPAGTVRRIVLLAPAVPAHYDLRPALRAACDGIHVFHSPQDYWYLRIGTLLAWTEAPAAGRAGFIPVVETPQDAALYSKLTQYPWDPSLTWTGHCGGHFGCYQQQYLRMFILPLLTPSS